MSDVLVKGMNMPTACRHGKCNFACSAAYQTGLICIVRKQYVVPGDIPRDCPCSLLVQPHGRLIDADALMKQIEHDTPLSAVFEKTMRRYLHYAPTIIPAEEQSGNSGELEELKR